MPRDRWFPSFPSEVPYKVAEAFRITLTQLYQLRDEMTPLLVTARGIDSAVTVATSATGLGLTAILPRIGNWTVIALATVNVAGAGDVAREVQLTLKVGGIAQTERGSLSVQAQPQTFPLMHTWKVTTTSTSTPINAEIQKASAATGTSTVNAQNSILVAMWSIE